jgi:hypothetical protein
VTGRQPAAKVKPVLPGNHCFTTNEAKSALAVAKSWALISIMK